MGELIGQTTAYLSAESLIFLSLPDLVLAFLVRAEDLLDSEARRAFSELVLSLLALSRM